MPVEEESKGAVATTAVWSAMDIDVTERQDAQRGTVSPLHGKEDDQLPSV